MTRRNQQAAPVEAELQSQPEDAVRTFEDAGGHPTPFGSFWKNLLEGGPHLIAERESESSESASLTLDHSSTP